MSRNKIVLLFLTLFILALVFVVSDMAAGEKESGKGEGVLEQNQVEFEEKYEKARVLEVKDLEEGEQDQDQVFKEQILTVEMLTGEYKGQILETRNVLSGSAGWDIIVNPGDEVIVYVNGQNGKVNEVYISDMLRTPYLNFLLLTFIIALIVVGGIRGVKSLVALGLTILAIYKVLLPALMKGYPPVVVTVLILTGVTLLTMFLIGGVARKSIAASLGTIGGVVIAGAIALLVGDLAHLTGFATEESRMLLYVENFKIDMQGLLFSGIIIGALGAVMDVAMSIASAVEEVKKANPALNIWQLTKAGMNVGRDIMGTMANTLILAYTGGALPLLILYMAYNTPGIRIFNSELIATEVVRALSGSIGLVFAIPVTAVISGILAAKETKSVYSQHGSV
ncbi:MAG: YibE/F family protein [Syntrophomonadaceae bacterium]|nr:YibE/F family protein [Syntrophomonadaceae bacterium]